MTREKFENELKKKKDEIRAMKRKRKKERKTKFNFIGDDEKIKEHY